jgi:hypothetical protein
MLQFFYYNVMYIYISFLQINFLDNNLAVIELRPR